MALLPLPPRSPSPAVAAPAGAGAGDEPAPLDLDAHARWVLATRIARHLAPGAWVRGGYASSALTVASPGQPPCRPAVAVVLGPLPPDGTVACAPLLVVELAPWTTPRTWIALGSAVVWVLGADGAAVWTADAPPVRTRGPGGLLLPTADRRGGPAPLGLPWPLDPATGPDVRIG